jgi:hypothetical protein
MAKTRDAKVGANALVIASPNVSREYLFADLLIRLRIKAADRLVRDFDFPPPLRGSLF